MLFVHLFLWTVFVSVFFGGGRGGGAGEFVSPLPVFFSIYMFVKVLSSPFGSHFNWEKILDKRNARSLFGQYL